MELWGKSAVIFCQTTQESIHNKENSGRPQKTHKGDILPRRVRLCMPPAFLSPFLVSKKSFWYYIGLQKTWDPNFLRNGRLIGIQQKLTAKYCMFFSPKDGCKWERSCHWRGWLTSLGRLATLKLSCENVGYVMGILATPPKLPPQE